jgi:hypothetical protein
VGGTGAASLGVYGLFKLSSIGVGIMSSKLSFN